LERGRLVCKAHRLVYHSTLGVGVIKKKKNEEWIWRCHGYPPALPNGVRDGESHIPDTCGMRHSDGYRVGAVCLALEECHRNLPCRQVCVSIPVCVNAQGSVIMLVV